VAKVITLPDRAGVDDNTLSLEPFCFRRAGWLLSAPAQVARPQAEVYQERRRQALKAGQPADFTPSYLTLKGSLAQTLGALFRFRDDESQMRQVYFLAGLMEAATGLSHDLLRSDLIRRVFAEIEENSTRLQVRWQSWDQGFLLPICTQGENLSTAARLQQNLGRARTLKEFLVRLKEETDAQFDLAGRRFIYYLPPSWTSP